MSLVLDTENVVFPQLVRASLGNGEILVVFSGAALVNLRGESTSNWTRDTLYLALSTAALNSGGRIFIHDQAAPLVTLNAVWDKKTAINAGFAVDSCRALPHIPLFRDWILIECEIAVRDKDAFLYRAGYHVTVTGRLTGSKVVGVKPTIPRVAKEIKKLRQV